METLTKAEDMGNPSKNGLRSQALSLAEACNYEETHTEQVCKLSLSLFDQLFPLHGLGRKERAFLEAAAILHDIGWIKGQKKHHKISQELIVNSEKLSISKNERILVGLIARYHRKSLPKASHEYFAGLDKVSRQIVTKLASFLRLADGLDRSHRSAIDRLHCEIFPKQLLLRISTKYLPLEDIETAREKSDLITKVFKRKLRIVKDLSPTHYKGDAAEHNGVIS